MSIFGFLKKKQKKISDYENHYEKKLIEEWRKIKLLLEEDVANVWVDEAKERLKRMQKDTSLIEKIEHLKNNVGTGEEKQEILRHLAQLQKHLSKTEASEDFIAEVDNDINNIIEDIKAESRRKFIKKLTTVGAGVALLPKQLYAQSDNCDISYGTFYSYDIASRRYWDIREIFKKGNVQLIQIFDLLGLRYRVITYFDREKEIALKKSKEKYAEIINYFNKPKFSDEDRKERIGEVGTFSRNEYKKFRFRDITPKVKPKKEIKKNIPDGFYIQFSSNLEEKYSIRNEASLISHNFTNAFIFFEKINGKINYKTLIGPYKDETSASVVGNKILDVSSLVDLLGYPEIVVIQIIKQKTIWTNAVILKKVKVETSKEKLAEQGRKKVVTKIGKKQIDQLIDLAVEEWNKGGQALVNKWNKTNKNLENFESVRMEYFKLDKNLVRAMVFVESHYNATKPGYKLEHVGNNKFVPELDKGGNPKITAYGLLQVRKDAAEEMGFDFQKVINDPWTNLQAGVAYFGKYYYIFRGDINRAIGTYNAGPGRGFKNNYMNYAETREHIRKVNEQWTVYGKPPQ